MKKIFFVCILVVFATLLAAQNEDWLWAVQAGGALHDHGFGIITDSNGNSYVTGAFNNNATFGSITLEGDNYQVFIAKIDPNGNWLWVSQAGGQYSDSGWDLKIDVFGNVYVTGSFSYTATFGATTLTTQGWGVFVAKLDPNGNWLWASSGVSSNYGGARDGKSISIDSNGNSYITGHFAYSISFGSTTLYSSGHEDIFVAKLDSNGNWLWAKKAGGEHGDHGNSIATDSNGNIYVTGYYHGSVTFGTLSLSGSWQIGSTFATKLDTNGNWLWAKNVSTYPGTNMGQGITVDSNGSSYITGSFSSSASFGSIALVSNGNQDIYIAKLDTNGNWLWAKQAGGILYDEGKSIVSDSIGNIFVTGNFENIAYFGTNILINTGDYKDVFITKLDATGNWLWAKQGGVTGSLIISSNSIALDDDGNCYIAGDFTDTAVIGSNSIISMGERDIFVAKLGDIGTGIVAAPTFSPASGSYYDTIDISIATATSGATIEYRTSTNGEVWSDWQTYTAPINIPLNTQMEFEAYAEKVEWQPSPIATATYTVTGTVTAPVFSPGPGIYTEPIDVIIQTTTEGATIIYRTSSDGGAWSDWQNYTEPINIPFDTQIDFEAYAEKTDWITSETVEAIYVIGGIIATAPLSGDGTIGNPYQIANLENLYWITAPDSIVPVPDQAARWSSHYIQTADIDTSPTQNWFPDGTGGYYGWSPIGGGTYSSGYIYFSGSYDGDGHTITGLYINRPTWYLGLFGLTSAASSITNLGMVDVDITASIPNSICTGALVGQCFGQIDNCYAGGVINGKSRTGGLIGELWYDGTITNSYTEGTVSGDAGGLVGLNRGTITNSYSTADLINSSDSKGGFVSSNNGTIDNCYATGFVSGGGNGSAGGFVYNNWGTITNSYATGDVTPFAIRSGGGFAAENGNMIANCYATGTVTSGVAGGFIGVQNYSGTVENCYALGDVINPYSYWDMYAGGFIGINYNNRTISNCYSRGNVTRNHDYNSAILGGFIGKNHQGIITNSFSTGWVAYAGAANPTDKGFAGGVDSGGNYSMSGNYWDMDTSNQATTAGVAEGRSTGHMTYPYAGDTYVGWDFTQTWGEDLDYLLNDGYPYLQMEVYVPQPQISVIPENFVVELNAGENIILPMTISNDGDAELIFSININSEVFTFTETQVQFSGSNSKNSSRNTVREEWLTAIPLSGTIPAGEDLLIDITFDAELLEPGNYNTDIIVVNNAQEDVIVPVELTVIDTVSAPEFSPEPGIYEEPIDVIIQTATEGANIIYRTSSDGGAWSDWQSYTEPINIPFDTQIDFEAYAEKDDWITSETVSANYVVTGTVATPTFTPEPGIYTDTIEVVIEVSEEPADMVIRGRSPILSDKAVNDLKKTELRLNQRRNEITIYYRTSTDGGAWTDWVVYTEPITIGWDTEMDIEAYGERDDWVTSDTVEASYTVTGTVATPDFSPEAGIYTESIEVVISTITEDATIMYRSSTDGGAWSDWEIYTDPVNIPLDTEMDFEAYAEKDDWITSETVSANYIVTGTVATPEFEPAGDVYLEAQTVTITTATTGATIEYSFDGEEWIEGDSVDIEYTTMLYARAYLENWLDSEIAEAMYYILNPPQELEAEGFAGYVHLNWQAPHSGDELILTVRNRRDNPIRTKRQSINIRDSDDLIGYNVYRQQDDEFILLNPEPISETEYDDEDLEAGEYTYHVTAIYDQGESNPSDTATATVNMVAIPTFSPEPGYYEEEIELIISCETEEAEIYYTLDGSEPTQESLLYTEPVILDSTVTVKARAFKEDWLPSEIAESFYEIEITDAEDDIILPIVTSLGSAYPNPFNPETTIPFSLSKSQHVSITIYNIRGQKVRELVNSEYEAGYHQIVWNGRDERGREVSGGVYLYRFQCGEHSVVKRMLLLK